MTRALHLNSDELPLGRNATRLGRVVGESTTRKLLAASDIVKATGRVRGHEARDSAFARSQSHLRSLRDTHRGERCVIIGNGPSLRRTDVSLLESEVTFGLNRVYLAFPEWGFQTNYLVSVNKFVAEQSGSELAQFNGPLFTTVSNMDAFPGAVKQPVFLDNQRRPGFYGDATRGIWEGATVTYVAMQLAFFLGFERVVLVGVDHRFTTTGDPHKIVESTTEDPNHFHPNYFGPGYRWQLPDLETSEMAYRLAQNAFSNAGRRIVDSTVGGALEVFDRVPLEQALSD